MDGILKLISVTWPIFVAIGGALAVVYATIRVKVPNIERRLRKIESMDFVTKEMCESNQSTCQKLICSKIDIIKSDLQMMNKQRQDARKENFTAAASSTEELKSIANFMGRVEQFMADHIKSP
jgi:50S ribosomal subunit-associated GTPase HflX